MSGNRGYMLLGNGACSEVTLMRYYGTHQNIGGDKDIKVIYGNIRSANLHNLGNRLAVHIEGQDDRPFTISELVLPDGIERLYINENVIINGEVDLPPSISYVRAPNQVKFSNILDFIDTDVSIVLYEEGEQVGI